MTQFRVTIELSDASGVPTVRWERCGEGGLGAFELLGRAFEVTQREVGVEFSPALAAFMKGAMIQRGDLEEMLRKIDKPAG